MGLVNNFLLCLAKGVPLMMQKPQDFVRRPALWLRGLAQTGATLTWSPNFGFAMTTERVRDEEISGVRLDGVRAFWNAAERIHLDTIEAFHRRFAPIGVRREALKTNLGCVENVGGATFSDPDGNFIVEHVDSQMLQAKRIAAPVSRDAVNAVAIVGVGRPVPGMDVAIVSPSGRQLTDGHVGEIALRTPSRMLGYLGDAPATRRALRGDLLRTGDLGYVRGGEVFWVGRVRERITVRGKKLDPSDFEPVLLHIAGLRAGCFAAFGVDDREQGTERIVIVAEVRHQRARTEKEIAAEIREQVFRRLDVLVSEVVLVRPGTLAKTSSGKRRHRHFHRLYVEGKLKDASPAAPAGEERIAV
jgi:acyl-CoA synthetase (AMP-forming)/AMP-acid ligase II